MLKLAAALLLAGLFVVNGEAQTTFIGISFGYNAGLSIYGNESSTNNFASTVPTNNTPYGLTPPYQFNGSLSTMTQSGAGSGQGSASVQITANSISVSANSSSSDDGLVSGGCAFYASFPISFTVPNCCYTLTGNSLVSGSANSTVTPPPTSALINGTAESGVTAEIESDSILNIYTQIGAGMFSNKGAYGEQPGYYSYSQSARVSTSGFLPANGPYDWYSFNFYTDESSGGDASGGMAPTGYYGSGQASFSGNLTLTVYPTDSNCEYALSDHGPVGFNVDGGTGSISVISANGTNCTWTATSDSDWLTITSGIVYTGSGTVSYTVSENCGTNRMGTLTLAGQAVTIEQDPVVISAPSDVFDANGSTNTITVGAGSNCTWTASSDSTWLTITSGASGTGFGTVTFVVAPNDTCSVRTGMLTIAGQPYPIQQLANTAGYSLDSTNAVVGAGESSGSVNVTAPSPDCSWMATSQASWLTITSGSSGTGNGTVTYNVQANDKLTEAVGVLTIAGIDFTVTQAAGTCGFTLDPEYAEYGYGGAADSVDVQCGVDDDCPWVASSGVPWITITAGGGGNGDGTVYYTVAANTSANPRNGSLTVAGQVYPVEQDGVSGCTYTVSPMNAAYGPGVNGGAISVTTGSGCGWTAGANASWLGISSGSSGTSNGIVGYSVAANTSTNWRSGTLTVAGRTVTVSQAGLSNCTCLITVSPLPANGGTTTGGGTAGCGSNVTVTATASAGYNFVNWTSGGATVSTSTHYTFLANSNSSLVGNFATGPTISTASLLPTGALGATYSQILQVTNGTPPYSWSVVSNGLPAGLRLGAGSGAITGTPTTVTTTNFAVEVSDANQFSTTQAFNVAVSIFPLQITSTTLPSASQNVFYSTSLGASGGQPPYSWSLAPGSASLPSSLSLTTNGLISGIPASSGSSYFLAKVKDSSTNSAQQLLMLSVIASTNAPIVPIIGPTLNNNGQFQFKIVTLSGSNYTIQKSTDLKNWTSVLTFSGSGGQETIGNFTASNSGAIFYRVKIGP
jgi:hypothetical protein